MRNAVADKIAQLVGAVHPEQLGAVYSALTQAATAPLINAEASFSACVKWLECDMIVACKLVGR